MEIIDKLKGSKTYGLCAVGLLLFAAVKLSWIELDPKLFNDLQGAITLAAIAALRAGVSK